MATAAMGRAEGPRWQGWNGIAFALLCAAILGVLIGTVAIVRRARAQLASETEAQLLADAGEARRRVEEELNAVIEHLLASVELQRAVGQTPRANRAVLSGLVASGRSSLAAAIVDGDGAIVDQIAPPAAAPSAGEALWRAEELWRSQLADTARRAATQPMGVVELSLPDAHGSTHRLFATPLADRRVLALLVDLGPLFQRAAPIVTSARARLVVLGAYGLPKAMSDPLLRAAIATASDDSALGRLRAHMRAGDKGLLRIDEREARGAALPRASYVAAYVPIELHNARRWSLALVVAQDAAGAHARSLVLRILAAAGAIVSCLLVFGVYVVGNVRRETAVRERLRAAARVAHLRDKAEKILDHVPVGVLVLAEDGTISSVNRALSRRLPADAVGRPWDEALGGAIPDRLRALVDAAAHGEPAALSGERLALFGPDVGEGQYDLQALPIEPRSPDARVLVVIEDVGRVRSLETQLVRAEKLATVGILAAGIAHEIGTPLGVVRARTEYLQGKLGASHPQADGLRVIVEQIDRVSRTIRQLLDFSRLRPAAVQLTDIAPVADAAAELLRLVAERKQVALCVAVAPDTPRVLADPDQLQQVFVNLAVNAIDACAPGGTVTLAASATPDGAGADIEVRDDGCGIDPAHTHRVFDPFFTTKKRGQGTGLGLTIVAQIVRNHHGAVELDSTPGAGTTVSIRWPARAAA